MTRKPKTMAEKIGRLESTPLKDLTPADFRYFPEETTDVSEESKEPKGADESLPLPNLSIMVARLKERKVNMWGVFIALLSIEYFVFRWGNLTLWMIYSALWAGAWGLQWWQREGIKENFGELGVKNLFTQARSNPMPWKMARNLGAGYQLVRDAPVMVRKFDIWRPAKDETNDKVFTRNSFEWVMERMREAGVVALKHFKSTTLRGQAKDSQTEETRFNEAMDQVLSMVDALIHRMTWTSNLCYYGTICFGAPLAVYGLLAAFVRLAGRLM